MYLAPSLPKWLSSKSTVFVVKLSCERNISGRIRLKHTWWSITKHMTDFKKCSSSDDKLAIELLRHFWLFNNMFYVFLLNDITHNVPPVRLHKPWLPSALAGSASCWWSPLPGFSWSRLTAKLREIYRLSGRVFDLVTSSRSGLGGRLHLQVGQ